MKPNELSELFNLSERRKYDIVRRGVTYTNASESDLAEICRRGAIALVTDDCDDPDVFPCIDVAVLKGYMIENGKRQFIVRKLSDLGVSSVVNHVFPLGDGDRPVVLSTDVLPEPRTCRVLGYSVKDNRLYVRVIGDEDTGVFGLPLEGIQAIKKEA